MERKYNKLTEEQLAFAKKQREENYLTEQIVMNVPMSRDSSEAVRRYFFRKGIMPGDAMARFAELAARDGKVVFDENGFEEGK